MCSQGEWTAYRAGSKRVVSGYVDAQNSFSAKLRSDIRCEVYDEGENLRGGSRRASRGGAGGAEAASSRQVAGRDFGASVASGERSAHRVLGKVVSRVHRMGWGSR